MPERVWTQMRFSLCPPAPKFLEPFRLRKGNAFGEKAAFFRKEGVTLPVSILQRRCDAFSLLRRCRSRVRFFRPLRGRERLHPPFLFSREKKETRRARCKEKRAGRGFAMTRSLLIDACLIIVGVANWSIVRMRLRISAADAHGVRWGKFFACSGSSFAMTQLPLLDACLIILCGADCSSVRMRLRISAAAAQWEKIKTSGG